jgi:hypothetical protein
MRCDTHRAPARVAHAAAHLAERTHSSSRLRGFLCLAPLALPGASAMGERSRNILHFLLFRLVLGTAALSIM